MFRTFFAEKAIFSRRVATVDEVNIGGDTTVDPLPDQRGAQPVVIGFLRVPNLAEDIFCASLGQSHVAASLVDPLTTAIVLGGGSERR